MTEEKRNTLTKKESAKWKKIKEVVFQSYMTELSASFKKDAAQQAKDLLAKGCGRHLDEAAATAEKKRAVIAASPTTYDKFIEASGGSSGRGYNDLRAELVAALPGEPSLIKAMVSAMDASAMADIASKQGLADLAGRIAARIEENKKK
jgi:molybdopterin-biosynthesis enzyme MoeA-like protein